MFRDTVTLQKVMFERKLRLLPPNSQPLLPAVGPMSLKVRSAKVPIVEEHECTSKINTVTEKVFILPASSFCAGGSDGSDACQVRRLRVDFP